ncbi:FAD dependent oxidoreductase [Fimicolochytrium jonesii]|uniref:FAD dependent oxidoreductase n=1 Tax=Fimicolochytrium jonesii TaxID=1396493 RepID=UPI0022FDB44C|nr:FAD dependent oxidoreductase [Fimicolochytrium jonesii]KAI8817133.1 FAD dependent oxidoreductase [Fimicolochytrium jonesii]
MTNSHLPDNPTASYWLRDLEVPESAPLPTETVDVAIIGAGISGLSVARFLQQLKPEWHIVVVEGRQLSGGATGRNGGLLVPGLHDSWTTTTAALGIPVTRKLLKFDQLNADALSEFVTTYLAHGGQPDPFFHKFKDGCLNVFATDGEKEFWTEDVRKMKAAGCGEGFELLDARAVKELLGTDVYLGAVRMAPAYRVWPAKLVLGLAKEVLAQNTKQRHAGGKVTICTQKLVEKVRKQPDGTFLITASKRHTLQARQVIVCTNSHTSTFLPTLPILPVKNQVIVTKPLSPPPPFDLCITANNGYEYLSTREDGRIVLGGMRHLVTPSMEVGNGDDAHLHPEVSKALRSYIPDRFPMLKKQGVEVEMEWAGIMGFSGDRLPFVGPVPRNPGMFVSAGFSGHGMPRAFLSGKAVAEMVAGVRVGEDFPEVFLPEGRETKEERVSRENFKSML